MPSGEYGGLYRVDGRGYNDTAPTESAVDRFNRWAMDNPIYGKNDVLERMSHFNNSSFFSVPDEPELDEYSQTLYLGGPVEHDIDGDPYAEFKRMQTDLVGETPDEQQTAETFYPELASQNAAEFIAQFGKIFR